MYLPVKKIIYSFTRKPKNLFLLDSLGAMLTSLLLFVVLINFNEYFGIPKTPLKYLSVIAAIFCFYSGICFLFLKRNWTPFIRAISIFNLGYCVLTIGLIIVYYPILTFLGFMYFLIELTIIGGLVYIELKVANEINK